MTQKILKALNGAIKKWERIVAGTGIDEGVDNCPLCALFYFEEANCYGCPIAQKTGVDYCHGTPYQTWDAHHYMFHFEREAGKGVYCPICKKLAKEELKFLKSLLPEKRLKGDQNE